MHGLQATKLLPNRPATKENIWNNLQRQQQVRRKGTVLRWRQWNKTYSLFSEPHFSIYQRKRLLLLLFALWSFRTGLVSDSGWAASSPDGFPSSLESSAGRSSPSAGGLGHLKVIFSVSEFPLYFCWSDRLLLLWQLEPKPVQHLEGFTGRFCLSEILLNYPSGSFLYTSELRLWSFVPPSHPPS